MTTHRAYQADGGLPDWGRELLARPLDAVVSTVSPDGSPHTAPVGFAFDGQQSLIASGATTRKVRNLETDPRARVLVMATAATSGIDDGWVAADGTAVLVRGEQAQPASVRITPSARAPRGRTWRSRRSGRRERRAPRRFG